MRKGSRTNGRSKMLAVGMSVCMFLCTLLPACGREEQGTGERIVVFNYGDYIERDVLEEFEEESGIKVVYEEFLTPEAMYTKYKNGTVNYDLICCSDYMLDKMIQEDEVCEIDFDQMEYEQNIGKAYWELSKAYDPENTYSVPYFWGTVGIMYNTKMVKGVPDTWEALWDEDYRDNIIMQDSVRDCFVPALIRCKYSLNTKKEEELHAAQRLLFDQKRLVQSYLVDEVRDDMVNEQAAMAVIYSGEAGLGMDYNEDLDFVVPKEGSNVWMDAWVIPKNRHNYEGALKFLDFLCREDIAAQNFDYIYYSTPNQAVLDGIDAKEQEEAPAIFLDEKVLDRCEMFQYLGKDMERFYDYMWKELKAY